MAHVWFDQLEVLQKKGLIEQLKKELNGNTLIGEYIGSQDHQHLVKYSRVTIIFFAIVTNESSEVCWPCEKSWDFFNKYGLDKVAIQSLGLFTNYETMCNVLCKTFKDVAKSEIAQDEEGNVLYLVKRTPQGKSEVLSLTKLKTLEYRLFRKMREKLRNFWARNPAEQTKNDY